MANDQEYSDPLLDFSTVSTDQEAARLFVHHLLEAAGRIAGPRQWTAQELSSVLDFAAAGGEPPASFMDGRHFASAVNEALDRAVRYRENFSVMIVHIRNVDVPADLYGAVIDGLTERLRSSDQVFLFRGKAGILLPYTSGKDLKNLTERLGAFIAAALGDEVTIDVDTGAFPDEHGTKEALLSWVTEKLASS